MRYLVLLFLFFSTFFANDAINGKSILLPISQDIISVESRNLNAPILRAKNGEKFALIAVPYRQKEALVINIQSSNEIFKTSLHVTQGEYPKEYLQVDPSKVSPPKSAKERISKEYKEAMEIYKTFTEQRYWSKSFIPPMQSTITSHFGNARTFNDKLKSYHSGTDFRAPIGTPVYAINDGVIVLTKERYYAGGSVIIDHGEGIYSVYYHLSKMQHSPQTHVKRGEQIGLSGNSGRVTGPHLHFGIMLQGTPVDPLHFIKTINHLINSPNF